MHADKGDGGLEFKALTRRQALGGGVGPGAVETFSKVKLGEGGTLAHVIEHLRNQSGGISEELEALLNDPMEVTVEKAVRKTEVKTEDGKASFEVTGARGWSAHSLGLVAVFCQICVRFVEISR